MSDCFGEDPRYNVRFTRPAPDNLGCPARFVLIGALLQHRDFITIPKVGNVFESYALVSH